MKEIQADIELREIIASTTELIEFNLKNSGIWTSVEIESEREEQKAKIEKLLKRVSKLSQD